MKNSNIIILNKKSGISSYKYIREIQKQYSYNKIGHAGTLDPMAEGMLIALSNKATKLSDFFMKKDKVYYVSFELGYETDTLDLEGKIIKESPYKKIEIENLNNVLNEFKGKIKQIPPMYSAIKVNGKKLYELARKNQTIDIKEREINIYYIKNVSIEKNKISFETKVSSGTYIRSLIRDIAYKLGTCATMTYLKRKQISHLKLKNDIEIHKVYDIIELDKININEIEKEKLLNGVSIECDKANAKYHCFYNNTYLGIVNVLDKKMKRSNFFANKE